MRRTTFLRHLRLPPFSGRSAEVAVLCAPGPIHSTDGKIVSANLQLLRLLQIPTQGQNLVPLPWCEFQAKATVTGSNRADVPYRGHPEYTADVQGATSANGHYQVAPDNRSVKLTRNVGQDEFGLDLEHTTYEDGNAVTYGDSLYSWAQVEPNGDVVPARNYQNVQAVYSGSNWTPDYQIPGVQWNWVPDGGFLTHFGTTPQDSTSFSQYSSKWLMKDGVAVETLPTLGIGESSWGSQVDQPQEFTLKYFARDVDGAESQALYKLTLHDPVDDVTHYVSGIDVTCGFLDVQGQPAVVDYANSLANPTINGTVDHSSGWSINGTIDDIKLFAKPLGLDVGYSSSTDYGTEKSITLDKDAQPVSPGMERQVLITYKYNRHHSFFSRWNANGIVRRMAYGPGSTTRNVEVQHEGFKDEYVTSSLSFGPEYNPDLVGHAPTPATPTTLPPPVSTFRS